VVAGIPPQAVNGVFLEEEAEGVFEIWRKIEKERMRVMGVSFLLLCTRGEVEVGKRGWYRANEVCLCRLGQQTERLRKTSLRVVTGEERGRGREIEREMAWIGGGLRGNMARGGVREVREVSGRVTENDRVIKRGAERTGTGTGTGPEGDGTGVEVPPRIRIETGTETGTERGTETGVGVPLRISTEKERETGMQRDKGRRLFLPQTGRIVATIVTGTKPGTEINRGIGKQVGTSIDREREREKETLQERKGNREGKKAKGWKDR